MNGGDVGRDAIEAGVVAGGGDRAPVDVAADGLHVQALGGGDRQHAGAGADVEHVPEMPPLRQVVERHEAAAGGAVMAGAEGERGLDLDRQGIDRHPQAVVAVVAAVHHEAAGAHRRQPGEALRHPVGLGQRFEGQRGGRVISGGHAHQVAHRHPHRGASRK